MQCGEGLEYVFLKVVKRENEVAVRCELITANTWRCEADIYPAD